MIRHHAFFEALGEIEEIRTQYEGKTFRENLGVPIPPNIHTKNRTMVQVNAAASND